MKKLFDNYNTINDFYMGIGFSLGFCFGAIITLLAFLS